jgi:diaminopimelate epimerase
MRFTKMEGLGNDYVYVDAFHERVRDPSALAKRVSDRHFGVGSDGLILILPSERADLRMEMYNSDGSRSEMCGNGLRCVGSFAWRRGLVTKTAMTVETGAGILTVEVVGEEGPGRDLVRIAMGVPRLSRAEIPMDGPDGRAVDEPIEVAGRTLRITAVSMGNPHAVSYVDDIDTWPVTAVGPALERHPLFPNRVNAEFVQVRDEHSVYQRTWERGAGETLACGTGAAAVCVAGILTGRTASPLRVRLRGGELLVEWDGEGAVRQTGPAVMVFDGRWLRGD